MIGRRAALCLAAVVAVCVGRGALALPPATRLLIALASSRDRARYPRVYFAEVDVGAGSARARPVGGVDAVDLRSDTRPSLSTNGRRCAFTSEQENGHSETRLWELEAKRELPAPAGLNSPAPELGVSLSGDGALVAFSAWNRPGSAAGWNVFLFDLANGKALDAPGLNGDDDEQYPSLSAGGRFVAFVSNRPGGAGASHIYLYDRQLGRLVDLPGLNSKRRDAEPSLSGDGRYLAFTSDRPGGAGSRDVYLYDRERSALVPLPGLNGPGPDQSPALSPDGRVLAFVAERASGLGERDVLLFDLAARCLIPVEGLNSKAEDFDPAVVILP